MIIDYSVPFYSNTPDDVHCWQASLRMVLEYFLPGKKFTWEEMDHLTGQIPGMWGWPLGGMVWAAGNGFEVKDIEDFDYREFSQKGKAYLARLYGEEVAEEQDRHSDIQRAQKLSKEFLEKVEVERKLPMLEEIQKFLKEGHLVICLINSQELNNKTGYVGHFVVIKGFTDHQLIFHDPGLPPQENRKVSFKEFEKAWAYPNEKAKNIMAFRLMK